MLQKILMLCLVALAAGAAQAESVRMPKTGVPAFAFDAPPGWTVLYDEYGNLRLTAEDHTSALQLSMIDDPAMETSSLEDLAAEILKAAGAPPFSKQEDGTIAGFDGTTFISQVTNDSGVDVILRVTLVKLDATHVASQGEMRTTEMTGEETEALNSLLGDVRLTLK
jgi:hypothetical protein